MLNIYVRIGFHIEFSTDAFYYFSIDSKTYYNVTISIHVN